MFKKIALGLAAIIAVLVLVIAMQPARFAVEREVVINAPADVIYPYLDNLRAWEAWSPFAKMDPQQKNTYEGPESGVGASTSWEGGREAGKGRATITAVKPNQEVDIELEFLEPMQATNRALFTLAAAEGATTVTWRLEGTNGFAGKASSLFMNMDAMVGGEFEKGLASMKTLAEAAADERKAESAE